jgi:hypothetical protein
MCYDDNPGDIIAREMKWDGFISGDDNIKLIFDTFNDDRTAYWFGTNPLGAQDDALLTDNDYSGFNEEWNGIWQVQSAITDSGWSAEFLFPFAAFKFQPGSVQNWGFNVQRGITRFGEEVLWTSWQADKGLLFIAEAGSLTGIANIKRGDPIYAKPFITAGGQWTGAERETVFEPGLDLKYGITKTITLDATFNTDFAQVEADLERINLTRFPLFFPEKRDFFLEGRKFFEFPLGNNDRVFYSRRIGLQNGKEIPLIGGVKLFGRAGKFQVGLLTLQTAEKDTIPSANFTTARVSYDILQQSQVGFILTNRFSPDGFNRSLGANAEFRFNDFLGDKNLVIAANIATAGSGGSDKDSYAGRFFIEYPNDLINQKLSYRFIQDRFNPGMGFIERKNFQSSEYYLAIEPRVQFWGLKKLLFKPMEVKLLHNLQGKHIGAQYEITPFGLKTVADDHFSFDIVHTFDRVENAYRIFNNAVIEQGDYRFTHYEFFFRSAETRLFSFNTTYLFGDYYNGSREGFGLGLKYRANRHITLDLDYHHNNIKLPASAISTNEFSGKLRYDFSNHLNSSLFTQWNNELQELNLNYRFNWKPKIGSDLFIVINQLFSTESDIALKDVAFLIKFVYLIIL